MMAELKIVLEEANHHIIEVGGKLFKICYNSRIPAWSHTFTGSQVLLPDGSFKTIHESYALDWHGECNLPSRISGEQEAQERKEHRQQCDICSPRAHLEYWNNYLTKYMEYEIEGDE